MKKQKTICDVAELAGVSVATASRALNDPGYPVSAQTRQKVRAAAERLEYVPNAAARSLRGTEGKDIALVIPNVSNPFYLQTMLGINEVLSDRAFSLILCNTMRDVGRERMLLRRLFERQTKGVILSSVDENSDTIREYMRRGMKFVLLDQMFDEMEGPGIYFDSRAGARMAVEYLIKMGHRKIGFATLPLTRWTRVEMYKGYHDTLLTAGLPYEKDYIYEYKNDTEEVGANVELEAGNRIAEDFLKKGCPLTAIVCINDMLAIGIIQTLLKNGVRVPQDVSVVGFDDIPFASAFMPSLTTIHYPAAEAGRLATLMLLNAVERGGNGLQMSMNLAPQLIIRDTTAPISGY